MEGEEGESDEKRRRTTLGKTDHAWEGKRTPAYAWEGKRTRIMLGKASGPLNAWEGKRTHIITTYSEHNEHAWEGKRTLIMLGRASGPL